MSGLLFCTGGSQQSGIGHIMRCQALAQFAEEQGLESTFWVNDAARAFILSRHDWTGRLELAPDDDMQLVDHVLSCATEQQATAIVVDGYGFSASLLEALARTDVPLVLLDDIRQPGFQHADIICNPAGEGWRDSYHQHNPQALLCLGANFRLLRREFSVTRPLPVEQRVSLTINMGGSDPCGLTLPVLKALTASVADAPFRVVTGPGFDGQKLAELVDFIQQSDCAIQHIHNCQDMADLWCHSRLAIAAAGGSQFELVACETPSVLLMIAENQRNASELAAEQGWCVVRQAIDNLDLPALAAQVSMLWTDNAQLNNMSQAAADVAVTDGAWQLLNAIAMWREDHVK